MGVGFEWSKGLTCSMQCADMGRSITWCTDVLGFNLLYKVDDMGWCELASCMPGVNVGYSQVEKPEVKGGATLTWGVKDIAKARKELEGKKVRFDGDTIEIPGLVRLATFFDPDGNKFMFFQDLQGQ